MTVNAVLMHDTLLPLATRTSTEDTVRPSTCRALGMCVCVCMWTAEHFDIHCSHFISAITVEDRHFYCHFPMKATKGVERKGSRATWPTFNARLTTHFGKALNFPLCLCFLICNGNKYNNSVLQDLNELI